MERRKRPVSGDSPVGEADGDAGEAQRLRALDEYVHHRRVPEVRDQRAGRLVHQPAQHQQAAEQPQRPEQPHVPSEQPSPIVKTEMVGLFVTWRA